MKPYCFVLMPFGRKSDENGQVVEFDLIYEKIIAPSILDADLEPVRADEEIIGGIIHKPMFERLMMCDYAIADLTTANANVFYELGIRHGVRPYSTILIAGSGMRLPFDVAPLRAILYEVDDHGNPVNPEKYRKILCERLVSCREPIEDSPLYQLVTDFPRPDIPRLKTDTFRDVVEYSKATKLRLSEARSKDTDAISRIEQEINTVDADPAIVVDILLSYRAVKDWQSMINLIEKMSAPLKKTILVQEQLGFALNRLGRHNEAEQTLVELIETYGPNSESNGILGRVYKDLWQQAKDKQNPAAEGYLHKAIDTYLEGFESDWRDAYPGINAVTLMEHTEPKDSRQKDLIPVVNYAVKRRLSHKTADYWDYATQLELCVLADDQENARVQLGKALASVRDKWELETTLRNIRLIKDARERNGITCAWLDTIERVLEQATL